MEGYRLQQLVYLVLPIMLGVEFFLNARDERGKTGRESAGALALDALGFVFAGIVPAVFVLTILGLDFQLFPFQDSTLHRLDRYGVMFCFLGSWWQVFLLTGLRARRTAANGKSAVSTVLVPYILAGAFISALILWVAPWNLMWVSIFWFVISAGVLAGLKVSTATIARVFLVFAVLGFLGENVLFVWLDAVV